MTEEKKKRYPRQYFRNKVHTTPHKPIAAYDYRDLIDRIGGPLEIHKEIVNRGWGAPMPRTCYRWWLRRTIPAPWVPYIVVLAQEKGMWFDEKEVPQQVADL